MIQPRLGLRCPQPGPASVVPRQSHSAHSPLGGFLFLYSFSPFSCIFPLPLFICRIHDRCCCCFLHFAGRVRVDQRCCFRTFLFCA
ncbi:hypothetical protein BDW71DRAFT_59511 [Aspergillus fruticulosus]